MGPSGNYLQVGRMRLLTADEEFELATKSVSGDLESRNSLVLANIRLVMKYARKFTSAEFDDLVGAGIIGLIRAAEKFDPSTGNRFPTYALWWIKQGVKGYMATYTGSKRHAYWRAWRLTQHLKLTGKSVKDIGLDEVGEVLGISPKRCAPILDMVNCLSFSNGASTVEQQSEDESPAEVVEIDELQSLAVAFLQKLSPRARTVVEMRFGIGRNACTLSEVGKALSISRQRVKQIESQALEMLRSLMPVETVRRRNNSGCQVSAARG